MDPKLIREQQEIKFRQLFAKQERQDKTKSRKIFSEKIGLDEAIKRKIFPALVTIKTKNGIFGVGFFQHSEWLVSNAHVIPSREILDSEVEVIDHQANTLTLIAKSSYHRPSNRDDSPDAVIINTSFRYEGNSKCLPTQFSGDEGYAERYTFYVNLNANNLNDFAIKFLRLLSKKNTYPFIYECEDGSEPQPGCSGSPIIEARVTEGKNPQWQFRVIGILYARCSANWYNANSAIATELVNDNIRLICAIPIIQDFSQILQTIILPSLHADREKQMAFASKSLDDPQGEIDSKKYSKMSQESEKLSKAGLAKFEDGDSSLNIDLPDGLEKLLGKDIIAIENSYLITQEKCTKEELKKAFISFMEKISKYPAFKIQGGDNQDTSAEGFFRVDVSGGKNTDWMLQVQDNTGKGIKVGSKSASSVFAIVKVPKDIVSILGKELSKLFLQSQNEVPRTAKFFSLIHSNILKPKVNEKQSWQAQEKAFENLISQLGEHEDEIQLQNQEMLVVTPDYKFKIKISSDEERWMFSMQANLEEDQNGDQLSIATVLVSKALELSSINKVRLIENFEVSKADGQPIWFIPNNDHVIPPPGM